MFQYLLDFDYRFFLFWNSFAGKSNVLDQVFKIAADYVVFFLIAGLAMFVFFKEKNRGRSIIVLQAFAAAFIGRALIIPVLRIFYFRDRPFVEADITQLLFHNPLENSWPSGHATVMFALAFTLFYNSSKWAATYVVLALVSSIARVIAGVHYPLDIVGGILVAALSTLFTKWIFEVLVYKKRDTLPHA